ncbi:BESS motif [Cinara cedri]|uniref:BESS motif n=1 Tax=Cinara cedri TaxID=506608 RepID=A0A5E4MK64_9HEMI|nr:BESS motif [Cinara cedri]
MSFLLPYMTNRKREANLDDNGMENTSTPTQNEIVDVNDDSKISENNYQESSALENENNLSNRNDENIDIRAKKRAIERKKLKDSKPHADPLYHFFMSMYHTTQKLPTATQLTIKNKIFETVSQAEAALLNNLNTSFQYYLDGSPQSTTT